MRVLCLVKGRREMTTEKSHSAFLSAATHPKARGTGLVAKLTEFALDEMKKEGVHHRPDLCLQQQPLIHECHKKLNFIHAGTVLRHHKDPSTGAYIDDLIYHRILY